MCIDSVNCLPISPGSGRGLAASHTFCLPPHTSHLPRPASPRTHTHTLQSRRRHPTSQKKRKKRHGHGRSVGVCVYSPALHSGLWGRQHSPNPMPWRFYPTCLLLLPCVPSLNLLVSPVVVFPVVCVVWLVVVISCLSLPFHAPNSSQVDNFVGYYSPFPIMLCVHLCLLE